MQDFIGRFPQAISPKTCQGLIDLFNAANKRKATRPGKTGKVIDKTRKDSVDLSSNQIPPALAKKYDPSISAFFQGLITAMEAYMELFPELKPPKTYPTGVYGFNIQRYYPGGQAYHAWHYENPYPEVMDRLLTWMTYLNTVEQGGETEFKYYDLKVSPEQGLTLIWPSGFTHLHRGRPAPEETKYIITGWFTFAPRS